MTIEVNEEEYLLLEMALDFHRRAIAKKITNENWKGRKEYESLAKDLYTQLKNLTFKLNEQRLKYLKKI